MKKILIAGGSGFVGEHLRRFFVSKYYEVYILSTQRNLASQSHVIYWNPYQRDIEWKESILFDAVINLAGANIGQKYWTKKRKQELVKSRIESTLFLKELIHHGQLKTNYFIQSSAVGYYGDRGSQILDETSSNGEGFLANLCHDWEQSIEDIVIPYSIHRLGVVFHPKEGAFSKLTLGLKFKILVILGRGSQIISWIDIEDLCAQFFFSIEHQLEGIYNAVAPQPVSYLYLLKKYNQKFGGISMPLVIPSFLVRFVLKDFSEMFLYSQKVSSKKIESLGMKYEVPSFRTFLHYYRKKF